VEVRQPAYATADVVRRYIEEIFFPTLEVNRQLPGCKDSLSIPFCDNWSVHCSDRLLREFGEKGVVVITDPSQT
jgi:hypothetical protein